jgi:O-methyltransferase involved in polyketide biosynthesis
MRTMDYSKISITAKLVAYFRQFSDIPFAQDVASYIKAEEAVIEIAKKTQSEDKNSSHQEEMADQGKIFAPLLEARYKSIVQVISKTRIKQVLELASGFSLRGLAMSQNADITYVESDLPGINDEKNKLIAALKMRYDLKDFSNHYVVTANALERSDLETVTARLKRDQPLIVVNEGLIPYLSADERRVLAENVRYLLSQFAGGAWITPDFTTRQLADADNAPECIQRFRKAIKGATERQLHEEAFDSEESINEFIAEHRFTGVSSYQTDEVDRLVSVERLGLSSQLVERLKPHMRIWLLSPQ